MPHNNAIQRMLSRLRRPCLPEAYAWAITWLPSASGELRNIGKQTYDITDRPHINAIQGPPTPYLPSVVAVIALPSSNVPRWLKGRP